MRAAGWPATRPGPRARRPDGEGSRERTSGSRIWLGWPFRRRSGSDPVARPCSAMPQIVDCEFRVRGDRGRVRTRREIEDPLAIGANDERGPRFACRRLPQQRARRRRRKASASPQAARPFAARARPRTQARAALRSACRACAAAGTRARAGSRRRAAGGDCRGCRAPRTGPRARCATRSPTWLRLASRAVSVRAQPRATPSAPAQAGSGAPRGGRDGFPR